MHLATGRIGGAKLAAVNLASAQLDSGLDAITITNDSTRTFYRMKSKITTAIQQLWQVDPYIVSAHSSSQVNLKKIISLNPDVIHVHNWFNLISVKNILQLGQMYPMVFSLHDERLLTGGCHLTYGCNEFANECVNCPAVCIAKGRIHKSSKEMKSSLANISRLGIVSPSEWLAKKFSLSSIGRGLPKPIVIPNVVPNPDINLREKGPKPTDQLRVGFISANLNEPLKNFKNLAAALELLSFNNPKINFKLFTAGSGKPLESKNYQTVRFGILKPEQMEIFWEEIDVLVVPSLIENFPTVIAEAAYRSIPVIASAVGGIPEMITHGENGFLVNPSVPSIASGVSQFLELPIYKRQRLGENNCRYFHKTFNTGLLVDTYTSTYSALIAGKTK